MWLKKSLNLGGLINQEHGLRREWLSVLKMPRIIAAAHVLTPSRPFVCNGDDCGNRRLTYGWFQAMLE